MPTVLGKIVHSPYIIDHDEPHFGIEIEVENVTVPQELVDTQWDTVADGSLRNGGVEFLSRGPWNRDVLEVNVRQFYEWLDRYNYTRGVRTSTHVHYNMLGKDEHQIGAALTVYALVEPIIYRYCGPLREENIYCVPWYRAPDEVEHANNVVSGRLSRVHMSCKYSGLYLEPLVRFGTLEFRQAPVFEGAEGLLTWCDIVERICESGFQHPEEVLQAFEELSPDEFVEGLFGDRISRILRGACEADFDELMERYDVEAIAESISRCTYNEKADTWFSPSFNVTGSGTAGYHLHRAAPSGFRFEPEYYDEPEDEEYYDEEDY